MTKVKIVERLDGGSMADTFLIEKNSELYVRKIAENNDPLGAPKLKEQWDWLQNNDITVRSLFPKTFPFVIEKEKSYFDMECISLPSLKDIFLDDISFEDIANSNILGVIAEAGATIAKSKKIKVNKNNLYILKNHIEKMADRIEPLAQFNILKSEEIIVNSNKVKNLSQLIEEIINNEFIMNMLQVDSFYRSHGDYTFQNILSDGMNFRVIDPRGKDFDSIYYDISKIFQSCHGKYDLLYEGNFEIDYFDESTPIINYTILNNEEKFNLIYEFIQNEIEKFYSGMIDKNWRTITKFYEASHFISMAPFRMKENYKLALLCYSIGVKILNEFLEECKVIENGGLQNEELSKH